MDRTKTADNEKFKVGTKGGLNPQNEAGLWGFSPNCVKNMATGR